MTGQSTVTATIAAYAGGSVMAIFNPQGGGAPTLTQATAPIDADGVFSIVAWDNTNAIYNPSTTTFIIRPADQSQVFAAIVAIAGDSEDISAAFDSAPAPTSGS